MGVYPRGNRLWIRYKDADGNWTQWAEHTKALILPEEPIKCSETIPRSLFAIAYTDRATGWEGLEFPRWTSREECEAFIRDNHLDVRQKCTIVEWRLVETENT